MPIGKGSFHMPCFIHISKLILLQYAKQNLRNMIINNSIKTFVNSEYEKEFHQINQLNKSCIHLERFNFRREIWPYFDVPAPLKQKFNYIHMLSHIQIIP